MKKLLILALCLLSFPVFAAQPEPVTITADGTTLIAVVKRNADRENYKANVYAKGAWGSGTLKLQWSPDGGTTKIDVTDLTYVVPTLTANGSLPIEFGKPNMTSTVYLYAVLSGATGPSLTVGVIDNN